MKKHNRDKIFVFVVKLFIKYKKNMILPEFVLNSRKNKNLTESGLDSFEHCMNQDYFKNYPYPVAYNYNSRGYRDSEWPDNFTDLQKSTWCVGDSFTTGLGCPIKHTWVNILQERINNRCINVSLDGASNHWIARKTLEILKKIQPKFIIIHWSFLTRSELGRQDLNDEQRRLNYYNLELTFAQLLANFATLIRSVEQEKNNTKVIHSFIPGWAIGTSVQDEWNKLRGPDWPDCPTNHIDNFIKQELQNFGYADFFTLYCDILDSIAYVPELTKLDLARDGYHYDKITATNFVDQLEKLILNLDQS